MALGNTIPTSLEVTVHSISKMMLRQASNTTVKLLCCSVFNTFGYRWYNPTVNY